MSSSPETKDADNSAGEGSGERGRKYKGVRRRKWGKWVSEIRLPNSRERVWLGSYDAPDKAARAFDAAFVCLRGAHAPGAELNFPDSPPPLTRRLDAAAAVDPQEVQAAALSHANRAGPTVVSASDGPSSRPVPAAMAMDDVLGSEAGVTAGSEDGSGIDWRPAMAPLYSPTGWPAGNAYDFLHVPSTPLPFGDDEDMEDQAGSSHAAMASLWSFDP
ncbi:ethylene-responsive transcription factor ERF017 [Brachypodium distachyon]|uniref:AP2/ERF domain-containing protein n=1 Tax=Brachypodium distachyon TaxID=15368 RepID=A0A0Q3I8D3_BRADI|nr:ethylene-responsive transcription factor ERF017 [Brachypodium distachyon]KQK02043.1 hypothetical protein BRADI_3g60018v3 [Brachypodium distachyon]|eukprot:XP_010236912.1 ethylene-responsive transcription factor ERF017 [Brachypodium distachyon]